MGSLGVGVHFTEVGVMLESDKAEEDAEIKTVSHIICLFSGQIAKNALMMTWQLRLTKRVSKHIYLKQQHPHQLINTTWCVNHSTTQVIQATRYFSK